MTSASRAGYRDANRQGRGLTRAAAIVFAVLGGVLIAFQIAMTLGAPWGAATLHGQYPGTFPGPMRAVALAQASVMLGFVAVVLSRAGIILPGLARWSRRLIWVVVAFLALNTVMNLLSPSLPERLIWTPVAALAALAALIVALSRRG